MPLCFQLDCLLTEQSVLDWSLDVVNDWLLDNYWLVNFNNFEDFDNFFDDSVDWLLNDLLNGFLYDHFVGLFDNDFIRNYFLNFYNSQHFHLHLHDFKSLLLGLDDLQHLFLFLYNLQSLSLDFYHFLHLLLAFHWHLYQPIHYSLHHLLDFLLNHHLHLSINLYRCLDYSVLGDLQRNLHDASHFVWHIPYDFCLFDHSYLERHLLYYLDRCLNHSIHNPFSF